MASLATPTPTAPEPQSIRIPVELLYTVAAHMDSHDAPCTTCNTSHKLLRGLYSLSLASRAAHAAALDVLYNTVNLRPCQLATFRATAANVRALAARVRSLSVYHDLLRGLNYGKNMDDLAALLTLLPNLTALFLADPNQFAALGAVEYSWIFKNARLERLRTLYSNLPEEPPLCAFLTEHPDLHEVGRYFDAARVPSSQPLPTPPLLTAYHSNVVMGGALPETGVTHLRWMFLVARERQGLARRMLERVGGGLVSLTLHWVLPSVAYGRWPKALENALYFVAKNAPQLRFLAFIVPIPSSTSSFPNGAELMESAEAVGYLRQLQTLIIARMPPPRETEDACVMFARRFMASAVTLQRMGFYDGPGGKGTCVHGNPWTDGEDAVVVRPGLDPDLWKQV